MQELLSKAKIDHRQLRQVVSRIAVGELSKISEVCYYPPLKAPFFELLYATGLEEKDIRDFAKRFWAKHPARGWKIHNVPATMLLIFIMHYFLMVGDKEAFTLALLYLLVRFYSNIMNIQIKYCNEDVFRYALDNLTRTHLFVREKTIANGILYLAKQLTQKWMDDISKGDVDSIAKFITEARHRMNQSIKSFAKAYYSASKEGHGIKTQREPESEEEMGLMQYRVLERGKRAIEETVKRITVYRQVDKKAMDDAKSLTKVKDSVAVMLAAKLADLKYAENIKIILQQFLKELKDIKGLCGSGFIPYVRQLMAIKRTKSTIYFKQQVGVLLEKLLKETKQVNWYESLTPQTKFAVNSYLAFYLTMFFRNTIC